MSFECVFPDDAFAAPFAQRAILFSFYIPLGISSSRRLFRRGAGTRAVLVTRRAESNSTRKAARDRAIPIGSIIISTRNKPMTRRSPAGKFSRRKSGEEWAVILWNACYVGNDAAVTMTKRILPRQNKARTAAAFVFVKWTIVHR